MEGWLTPSVLSQDLTRLSFFMEGQMTSDDIEAMAMNPPSTATVTSAICTPLPRQPKQIRCRQFLAP